MSEPNPYAQASMATAADLHKVASDASLQKLSALSLPEIDAAVDAVSRLVPAGNIPAMILSGLAHLPDRQPPTAKRDVNLLFQGIEKALDKAVYGTFFAGPAAVIWGYQHLLKLAGKQPENAFPEGVWQFYAEYALREDTARFTIETHGFDTILRHYQIDLTPLNRLTAWAMAAIHILHQYDELLRNEWRERTYCAILEAVTPDDPAVARLYQTWLGQRPFGRGQDALPEQTYADYRRQQFDHFLRQALEKLDRPTYLQWNQQVQHAKAHLPLYQRQMSILASLTANPYGDERQPLALKDACIGLIYQGRYYLLPVCQPDGRHPALWRDVQARIATILRQPTGTAAISLTQIAQLKRQEWSTVRPKLNATLLDSLNHLSQAPILLNADQQSSQALLSDIRSGERGVGEHALTIFDTGKSFVFDQSHIFFDGAWSAALAEILTREAQAWAVYLHSQPPAPPESGAVRPLPLPFERAETVFIRQSETVQAEVTAESDGVQLKLLLALRKMFKMRSDLLQLTVNDLLVLYRAIHAVTYQADPDLMDDLTQLAQERQWAEAAHQAQLALQPQPTPPAILIPIDASRQDPRERLHPLVFTVPLADLDLLALHERALEALKDYEDAPPSDRQQAYTTFDQSQREYLATLVGFGQLLAKARTIAVQGEATSQGALKLLAHMPPRWQHLLDQVPNRFDLLNDLMKGREVFSNVGAVVRSSTLTRFNTAKDDNDKKSLAWGVMTDAQGTMRLSLRDFRPHVGLLVAHGRRQLAVRIAQHYLQSYVQGLNGYVQALRRITKMSRETQLVSPPRPFDA